MKVTILNPNGYCSGVSRAIEMTFKAKKDHPNSNIYVLGMLVHNKDVISLLDKEGIVTLDNKNPIEEINKLNKGDILIFTAHGHDEKYDQIAIDKGLIIYDAVCPKVKSNLTFIKDKLKEGHQIIYIGENNHPEALAALSISKDVLFYDYHSSFDFNLLKDDAPYVINQTTLNILDIKDIHSFILKNVPNAQIQDEICNATRKRQEALLNLDKDVDAIIVVGDQKSANTNRLFEIAKKNHLSLLIEMIYNVNELDLAKYQNKKHIAISSGASTPKQIVDVIYNALINIK